MFKTICIQRFQGHENTRLDLVPGVNVIYGLSQAGKTAIIRALKLILTNRPSGASFYPNFCKQSGETVIQVEGEDGTWVEICKSVKRDKQDQKKLAATEYRLTPDDLEEPEKTYSPGRDVPDEIAGYFRMGEVNISAQFARPFLIFSPPGEIGRTINRLTRLEEADGWKAELTKRINKKNQEVEVLNRQSRDIEQQLKKYKGFEELEDKVAALDSLDQTLTGLQARRAGLDRGLVRVERYTKELDRLQKALQSVAGLFVQLESKAGRINTLKEDKNKLERIIYKHEQVQELTRLLKIHEAVYAYRQQQEHAKALGMTLQVIESGLQEIQQSKKALQGYRDLYVENLKKNKKCPVCFSVIDGKVIGQIEEAL